MKAVGLFSGGLDSALAIKLVQDQGIEVVALNFVSPFCTCVGEGCSIVDLANRLKVPIKVMNKGTEYLKILKHPKHGYGRAINPCIDCKIFILKRAKKYAKEIGAKFIFTGEVLGQRPMSQHYQTLMLIEKEAGLKGKIVRPLCAGLLKPTEAEKKGWIDREKLLKFEGRRRTPQLDLARKYKIDGFLCGGGGCRLTHKEFALKLKDLFDHKKRLSIKDIMLLKCGRHFRYKDSKIIVGRNELENKQLHKSKQKTELIFEAKECVGPITLLQGPRTKKAVEIAAQLTARYSDAETEDVIVKYGNEKLNKELIVNKIKEEDIELLRIKWKTKN
jgi:tRNA U34 2-thiouridine synthase MnmA/TrmU